MTTTDAMQCRACGREERASEGYPCQGCGTFICQPCNMRGIVLCKKCQDADTVPRPIVKPAAQ
jgi:hypothetical protein